VDVEDLAELLLKILQFDAGVLRGGIYGVYGYSGHGYASLWGWFPVIAGWFLVAADAQARRNGGVLVRNFAGK
jgi:hypothetical protein